MGFGSFVSSALGAIGNVGSSAVGSALGALGTEYSAKVGYRYGKKQSLYGPSHRVEGLRRAGLNPILAADGNTGSMSAVPFNPVDIAGQMDKYSASKLKSSQVDVAESTADRERATTDLIKQQEQRAKAEAGTAKELERMTRKKAKAYDRIPGLGYLDAINHAGAGASISSAAKVAEALNKIVPKPRLFSSPKN